MNAKHFFIMALLMPVFTLLSHEACKEHNLERRVREAQEKISSARNDIQDGNFEESSYCGQCSDGCAC